MDLDYGKIRELELELASEKFDFASEMQKAARNPVWKSKLGLWTLLSASCNDAASKCFDKITNFTKNLIDIDTCNVEALKSIAQETDLEYLVKDINTSQFPAEISDMIDMLSLNRNILMDKNEILSQDANDFLYGEIAKRSDKFFNSSENVIWTDGKTEELPESLVLSLKEHAKDIKSVFNVNMIYAQKPLSRIFKYKVEGLEYDSEDDSDEGKAKKKSVDAILKMTVEELLDNIEKIDFSSGEEDIHQWTKMKLTLDGSEKINWIYLLVCIIRQTYYNEKTDTYIVPSYFNKVQNIEIDLTPLFANIINKIAADNEAYVKGFICWHFYELICSKLRNDKLKALFEYDSNFNVFKCTEDKYKDFSFDKDGNAVNKKEAFIVDVSDFLTDSEIERLLSTTNTDGSALELLQSATKELADFGKYLKCVNSVVKVSSEKIKLDVLKILFPEKFGEEAEKLSEKIFSMKFMNTATKKEEDGLAMKLAKELTDICIHINKTREKIKTSILQFEFVGTKKIATDILRDFFLENYTLFGNEDYISESSLKAQTDLIESGVLKPLSTLLGNGPEESKFSIDVVEYYDKTQYLNIESDLGEVVIGQRKTGEVDEVSYFIDSNNLIASSLVKTPVYEDIKSPCASFIKDYNSKFWTAEGMTIGTSEEIKEEQNFKDYQDFYSQYVPEYSSLSSSLSVKETKKVKEEILMPLLEKAWSEFALSGYDNRNANSLNEIRKHYIGQKEGDEYYKNIANKYFPTIAPSVDIRGLKKISDIDEMNILWLAKTYYMNVASELKTKTKSLVLMSDSNGVPFEDWRQAHVSFHGYSTYYENAKNENIKDTIAKKTYEIDGPWSYSEMQKIMYNFGDDDFQLQGNEALVEEEIKSLLSPIDIVSEDSKYFLSALYKEKILDRWLITTALTKTIVQNETDLFDNTYSLFKDDVDSATGEVIFRSYDMLVGLPLADMLNADAIVGPKLKNIAKNCVQIGAVNDILWMYGLDEGKYSFVAAQVKLEGNMLEVVDYNTLGLLNFNSLNDFIGCVYDNAKNVLKVFSFDSVDELMKISATEDEATLFNYDMNIILTEIDTSNISSVDTTTIKKSKTVFPCILKHIEEDRKAQFEDSHRIWKIEEFKDNINIAYEALNKLNQGSFGYYLTFAMETWYFEYRSFSNEMNMIFADMSSNPPLIQNYFLSSALQSGYLSFNLPTIVNEEKAVEKLSEFLLEFPKCQLRKNTVITTLIGFNGAKKLKERNEKEWKEFVEKVLAWMRRRKEFNKTSQELRLARQILEEDGELSQEYQDFIDRYGADEEKDYIFMKSFSDDGCYEFIKTTGEKAIDEVKIYGRKETEWLADFDMDVPIVLTFDKITDGSGISLNELYDKVPSLLQCIADTLKIVVFFKNSTGITFINDYSLDADISCYIDDETEKKTRVGYWAGFNRTKYIEWSGDRTKGNLEWIEINPYLYFKDNPRQILNRMRIILNVCWHDESELMFDKIYAAVSFNGIYQTIDLPIVGMSSRECKERSLVIDIDKNTKMLSYHIPKQYFVLKMPLKDEMKGFEDPIPDVQAGLINILDDEIENIKGLDNAYAFDNGVLLFGKEDKFGLRYRYATLIFTDFDYRTTDDNSIRKSIESKVESLFSYTSQRWGDLSFKALSLGSIYFGYAADNKDEIGANYLQYFYLNPKYFRKSAKIKGRYGILSVLKQDLLDFILKNIDNL